MGECSLEKDDTILLQEIKANVDKVLRKIKRDCLGIHMAYE